MNNIKKARVAAGLSQKYVAATLNVAGPSVSNWENGKTNPTPENLSALADLFNVSVDYLMGREEPPQSAVTFPGKIAYSDNVIYHNPPRPEIVGGIMDYGSSTSDIARANRAAIHSALDNELDTALDRLTLEQKRQALAYIKFLETQGE